jgi:hypothetical protein
VKKATGKDIVFEENLNSSKGIISLLNIIRTAGMNPSAEKIISTEIKNSDTYFRIFITHIFVTQQYLLIEAEEKAEYF